MDGLKEWNWTWGVKCHLISSGNCHCKIDGTAGQDRFHYTLYTTSVGKSLKSSHHVIIPAIFWLKNHSPLGYRSRPAEEQDENEGGKLGESHASFRSASTGRPKSARSTERRSSPPSWEKLPLSIKSPRGQLPFRRGCWTNHAETQACTPQLSDCKPEVSGELDILIKIRNEKKQFPIFIIWWKNTTQTPCMAYGSLYFMQRRPPHPACAPSTPALTLAHRTILPTRFSPSSLWEERRQSKETVWDSYNDRDEEGTQRSSSQQNSFKMPSGNS